MSEHELQKSLEDEVFQTLYGGLGGLVLSMIGPFTCYFSVLIGLPLAGWATWKSFGLGRELQDLGDAGATVRRVNGASQLTAIIGLCSGGFYALIIFGVMLMYGAMILAAIAAAIAGA